MEHLPLTTRLNVRNLADLCGCFHALVWDVLEEPIQPIEVLRAIINKDRLNPFSEPTSDGINTCPNSINTWTREDHIYRIAWLEVHGWDTPIEVNFGKTFYSGWPIVDGLHRVAAAVVRRDIDIEAVVSGSLKNHPNLMATSCIRLDDLQLADLSSEEVPLSR